jgi:hypothetical protein
LDDKEYLLKITGHFNITGSTDIVSGLIVNPWDAEQIEKGEQSPQSFFLPVSEFCSVLFSSSQLSKTEQGITALNKI